MEENPKDDEVLLPVFELDGTKIDEMTSFLLGNTELPEEAKGLIDSITEKSSLLMCYILVQQLQRVTHLTANAAAVEKVIFSQTRLETLEYEELQAQNVQIHKQLMDTMEYCRKFVYQNKDILAQVGSEEDALLTEIRKLSADDRAKLRAQLIAFREKPTADPPAVPA